MKAELSRVPNGVQDGEIPSPRNALARPLPDLPHILGKIPGPFNPLEVVWLCKNHDAVLLYGSCARGDAKPNSDIDLLVVGETKHDKECLPERFSLTTYTSDHLRRMARRGSLFVLHLRDESKILVDTQGILKVLLNEWRAPDFQKLRTGIKAASDALYLASRTQPPSDLRRMTLFVLRSALYAACAERGRPCFAMPAVALALDDNRVSHLFEGIETKDDGYVCQAANELFTTYLGAQSSGGFDDLEALAVSWHRIYPMASYIALQLLAKGVEIGYTSAPMDWVSP